MDKCIQFLKLELIYVIMCKYLYLNVQTKCEQAGSSKNFYANLDLSRKSMSKFLIQILSL